MKTKDVPAERAHDILTHSIVREEKAANECHSVQCIDQIANSQTILQTI